MTKKQPNYQEIAEQLAQENAQLNDALLRERADAMNVRKRAEEERMSLAGFFKASVVKEILPVLDNLERALKSQHPKASQNADDFHKGIVTIYKQFLQVLERLGVEKIKTVGEHFDPHLHEAVTMQEGEGKEEIVSEELQSGYKMGDEVLRHAMVRVANK